MNTRQTASRITRFFFIVLFKLRERERKRERNKKMHEKWNSPKLATVLNPRYITRISWRVNFVNRHKSSKATGIGFGVRADGSNSNRTTSSSIGLSGGVAMLHHSQLSLVHFVFCYRKKKLFFFHRLSLICSVFFKLCSSVSSRYIFQFRCKMLMDILRTQLFERFWTIKNVASNSTTNYRR